MDWSASVRQRPVSDETLKDIHASDQDMYPADLPFARLREWVKAAPELSIDFFFEADGEGISVGVVVAMPVRLDRWQALLSGDLKETDVEASSDFGTLKSEAQQPVGVHIFHIERHASQVNGLAVKGFGQYAVDVVVSAARGQGYDIIGTSALTATDDGRRTFERMGFRPTGYEEVWMEGEAPRTDADRQSTGAGDAGGGPLGRARMMRRDEPGRG